jgi:hypothetical protein
MVVHIVTISLKRADDIRTEAMASQPRDNNGDLSLHTVRLLD